MVRIDKMYYINLEHRTDRKEHMEGWLKNLGLLPHSIERIDAVYNKEKGYIGCTQSHIKALETFLESDHNVCCIFEDDYTPVDLGFFLVSLVNIFVKKVDFDIVFLAYNGLVSTETEYQYLVKPSYLQTMSGYMITREFAPKLIENLKESMNLALEHEKEYNSKNPKYCNDIYMNKLIPDSKWFVHVPRLGYQIPSYSDLEYRHVNYGGV